MIIWPNTLQLLRCLPVLFFLLIFSPARAGLIIEISERIDVSSIKSLRLDGNNLLISYGNNRQQIIVLPRGGMDNLLLWVKQPCSGPFVISVDGALVSGAKTYTSPCLPPELADAMIGYDVYAHSFAQGEIPRDTLLHPLILKTGNISGMPHAQFAWLMDSKNQSPNALWYRNLMARFPSRPGVIGEFTIRAEPSGSGFPVKIGVISHRWFRPNLWYREVTAASEFDNTALDLPYAPLKKDIETDFAAYRKNFKPFDELASFVEAYALLKKIIQTKPELWNQLLQAKCPNGNRDCIQPGSIKRQNGPTNSWDYDWYSAISWEKWSTGTIGEVVETSQEADLALCHLWNSGGYLGDADDIDYNTWKEGIEIIAEKDAGIQAKYLLYQFKKKTGSNSGRKNLARQFFDRTHSHPEPLRLRIVGCQKMEELESSEWLTDLVNEEQEKIVADFVAAVDALKKQQAESNDDFVGWEELSQTVYSTGLLSFLENRLGEEAFAAGFGSALAYVHYRRGLAFQRGEELAYQHAHFRYLGYLRDKLDEDGDAKLRQTILDYQKRLAERMGIQGWNNADFEDAFGLASGYDDYYDDGEKDPIPSNDLTTEPWRNGPFVEGELASAESLFTGNRTNTTLPSDGSPAGIHSADGGFNLLLMDSRLLANAKIKGRTSVRAWGITYPGIKALTPFRLETKDKNGDWQALDIPHSGTSVRGVFNGQ